MRIFSWFRQQDTEEKGLPQPMIKPSLDRDLDQALSTILGHWKCYGGRGFLGGKSSMCLPLRSQAPQWLPCSTSTHWSAWVLLTPSRGLHLPCPKVRSPDSNMPHVLVHDLVEPILQTASWEDGTDMFWTAQICCIFLSFFLSFGHTARHEILFPTRDWILVPCIGTLESQPLDLQGSSCSIFILPSCLTDW